MELHEVTVGMKVKKRAIGGSTGEYVKEPIYTVLAINEYGDVEYSAKNGGKRWACHPSWLVGSDVPSGPVSGAISPVRE